ncbi:MAG: hypothetical protein ABFD77_11730 [Thermotogota bacterium]
MYRKAIVWCIVLCSTLVVSVSCVGRPAEPEPPRVTPGAAASTALSAISVGFAIAEGATTGLTALGAAALTSGVAGLVVTGAEIGLSFAVYYVIGPALSAELQLVMTPDGTLDVAKALQYQPPMTRTANKLKSILGALQLLDYVDSLGSKLEPPLKGSYQPLHRYGDGFDPQWGQDDLWCIGGARGK